MEMYQVVFGNRYDDPFTAGINRVKHEWDWAEEWKAAAHQHYRLLSSNENVKHTAQLRNVI